MPLPVKLLSQPSPDTSGAIAADTRKLASNEALQRLKTSGALDVQKQKGRDQLSTTALPLGLDPNSPNFPANLANLFSSLQGARHAGTVGDAAKGGLRITSKDPVDISQPLPMMTPGQLLPSAEANPARYEESDATTVNDIVMPDGTILNVPRKRTRKQTQKSQVKSGSLKSAQQSVKSSKKKFDPQSIPSSGLPFVHPNGQAGTIYNVGGRILFTPNPS